MQSSKHSVDCFEKRKKPRRMTTGIRWDLSHGKGINAKRTKKLKYVDDYDRGAFKNAQ